MTHSGLKVRSMWVLGTLGPKYLLYGHLEPLDYLSERNQELRLYYTSNEVWMDQRNTLRLRGHLSHGQHCLKGDDIGSTWATKLHMRSCDHGLG